MWWLLLYIYISLCFFFTAKVGGWMSLAVGASVISGIELLGISVYVLYSFLPQEDKKDRKVQK